MSDSWDNESIPDEEPREFLVSVELYISNATAAALRKPLPPRKKERSEKRESTGEDIRLKEKPSSNWNALQSGTNVTGHWRSATCRLLEEGERCLLNVYIDESQLYQTVYIHLLNQTDIRQADGSLFYRKDCVGIFCIAGQRWTSAQTAEPLYLQFPNSETCLTWQALLKSYAIPEIYGRWFFPEDGGSYRMWRQVELTVIQGRSMALAAQEDVLLDNGVDNALEAEEGEGDISCEIHLNDIICSRTTTKKGLNASDWHESFTFPGLPPFDNLDIVVWRERRFIRPTILGVCRISLANFRRGEAVEGWFPILQNASIGTEIQFGELRLKLKVDEEIILPYTNYAELMKICKSRCFLDWMSDLESRLKLKAISTHLLSIAVATNTVVEQVQEYASKEVDNSSSHQTLFRGNTILTKTIELCMTWYGKAFLEASIGTVLRRLCTDKVAIEVDPMRSGKNSRDVERNVELLIYWCQEFWNQIYSVRAECPNEMRMLFKTIRKLVEKRYPPDPATIDTNNNLPRQSVSAFCFLRFIVPAILHPHLFGLCHGLPSPPVQRSLTLIAKVIQSLANLNANVQKEAFMRGVQDFVRETIPAMIDYISIVSTPVEEIPPSISGDGMDRHDKINIVNTIRQRTRNMAVLDRESVPILPHLLDVPKHLAIITSAVVRSSRELSSRVRVGDDIDTAVDRFCGMCFEVEEEALERVSHLAKQLASKRTPSVPNIALNDSMPEHPHQEFPRSNLVEVTSTVVASPRPPRRQQRLSRPSTAPSGSGSLISQQISSAKHSYSNEKTSTEEKRTGNGQNNRSIHSKAPSTDSFPASGRNPPVIPVRLSLANESTGSILDDNGRRKKGLLKGIGIWKM